MGKRRLGYTKYASQAYIKKFDAADAMALNLRDTGGRGLAQAEVNTPEGLLRREYMAFRASPVSEIGVPLALGLINGAAVATLVKLVSEFWYFQHSALWAGIAALVAAWLTFYTTAMRLLNGLFVVEEYGAEIEDEPAPVRVAPAPSYTPIYMEKQNGGGYDVLRFGIEDAKICAIARHLLTGGKFSQTAIRDVAGQTAYATLRPEWLNAGLLRVMDERGTTELTPAGASLLRKFLNEVGD